MFFKPAQRPIHGCAFNFSVGQSVLLQAGRQLVTMRCSIFPEHIEYNRFHKPVNIPHGSGAWMDVDTDKKTLLKREDIEPPPHQPGLLPPWLAERGVNMIIAGGMGQHAQRLFAEQGIKVIVGAPVETPETLVVDYMAGALMVGENFCDH